VTTKVVCCYARDLQPETRQSVTEYAPGAEFIDCSADDFAYWRAIKSVWDTGEALVIIEQDMEIKPDTIASFDECDRDWCAFPYRITNRCGEQGITMESLGCTRFSAPLQAAVKVRHISQDDYRHWGQVAPRVAVTLTRYGYQPHLHEGLLEHRHDARDYAERLRSGLARRKKCERQYQEYLTTLDAPLPPENENDYWRTRYDLPSRR
jgi:hypothetical protein